MAGVLPRGSIASETSSEPSYPAIRAFGAVKNHVLFHGYIRRTDHTEARPVTAQHRASPMKPGCYRARLFLDICYAAVLPTAALALLMRLLHESLGYLTIPLHLASILLWACIRRIFTSISQAREMRQLDARPIPCVVGKWPGNIDVLFRMIVAFKTSYILDVYLQLFEEYQSTVLNTRFLWVDNVTSLLSIAPHPRLTPF